MFQGWGMCSTEFPMASGELSEAEFTAILDSILSNIHTHSTNGAIAAHEHQLGGGREQPLD
jgi:hypothetical protein